MKIAFFINRDLYGCMVLNLLRPFLSRHEVWLAYSEKVGAGPSPVPMLETLRFHEQVLPCDILFPKLEAAGPDGVGEWLTLQQLSHQYRWPVTVVHDLKQPDLFESVRMFAPDVMVSVRFGKIFKNEWIKLAPHGILNLHSGLLPEYRGVLATFWTLLQRRTEYGCTLHWIDDDTIDTGRVIETVRLPITAGKSLASHIAALYPPGANAIGRALRQLAEGKTPAYQEQKGKSQYFGFPQAADCERFLKQGGTVIDYAEYAELLKRFGPTR